MMPIPRRRAGLIPLLLAWSILRFFLPWEAGAQDSALPAAREEAPAAATVESDVPAAKTEAPAPPSVPLAPQTQPDEAAPAAPRGPVVALLDLESATLDEKQARALSQTLWARLNAEGDLRLPPRDKTRLWLISHDLHPFMPYRPAIPLAEVTRALRADYLVTGHVDQVEETVTIALSVFSARAGKEILKDIQTERIGGKQLLKPIAGQAGKIHAAIERNEASGGFEAGSARHSPAVPIKEALTQAKVRRRSQTATPEKKTLKNVGKGPGKLAAALDRALVKTEAVTSETKKTVKPLEAAPPVKAVETPNPASTPAAAAPSPRMNPPAGGKRDKVVAVVTAAPTLQPAAKPEVKAEAKATPPPEAGEAKSSAADEEKAKRFYLEAIKMDEQSPERLKKLEAAAALAPGQFDYQKLLATSYYCQRKYEECVKQCDKVMKLRPGDSMPLTIKGAAYFEQDKYEQARQAYDAAIKMDPGNDWARYNLALAYTLEKSPKAAPAWQNYLDHAKATPSQKGLMAEARKHLAALKRPATK